MESLAKLVRGLRDGAGLSQRALARRAGTSQPAIARYERGAAMPSLGTLERLAAACGQRLTVAVEAVPEPHDVELAGILLDLTPEQRLRALGRYARLHASARTGIGAEAIVNPIPVRRAESGDAPEVARLLHAFNAEFDEPTPEVPVLTGRVRELLERGEMVVLLAGGGERVEGLAQLRFRPSLWTGAADAYLEELYVVPERRGRGIGRALLEAAMEAARQEGAAHFDLTTSEDDTAALSLYESAGFTNREGSEDGPKMLYYERDL